MDDIFDYLDAPVKRVCAPDTPAPFSPPLEDVYVPSKERIKQAVKSVCYMDSGQSFLQSSRSRTNA